MGTVHWLNQEFYDCVTAQVPHAVLAAGAEVPGLGAALRAAALPQERGVQAGGVQGDHILPKERHQQYGPSSYPGVTQVMSTGDPNARGHLPDGGLRGRVEAVIQIK